MSPEGAKEVTDPAPNPAPWMGGEYFCVPCRGLTPPSVVCRPFWAAGNSPPIKGRGRGGVCKLDNRTRKCATLARVRTLNLKPET